MVSRTRTRNPNYLPVHPARGSHRRPMRPSARRTRRRTVGSRHPRRGLLCPVAHGDADRDVPRAALASPAESWLQHRGTQGPLSWWPLSVHRYWERTAARTTTYTICMASSSAHLLLLDELLALSVCCASESLRCLLAAAPQRYRRTSRRWVYHATCTVDCIVIPSDEPLALTVLSHWTPAGLASGCQGTRPIMRMQALRAASDDRSPSDARTGAPSDRGAHVATVHGVY